MHAPRRRGIRAAAPLALLIALPACGGDEALDPQVRAPAPGTYVYEALVYRDGDSPPDTFTGSLVLDVSSEDSIVGSWAVEDYAAEARGIWNITAYTLPATPRPPVRGSITHRVWRAGRTGELSCTLTYQLVMPSDTFTSSTENRCSLERSR